MHPSSNQAPPLLVSAALLIEQGRILITQRPEDKPLGGFWEFPGGKLHPGESPKEALHRELQEEIGIEIQIGEIFEVIYHRYDWGDMLLLAYLCRRTSGEIRNLEVADHRWISPDQIENFPLLPADRPLLEKISRKFSAILLHYP